MLVQIYSTKKTADICCSQWCWLIGPLLSWFFLTFDLVAWVCPVAGLTLAVQPAVSLEGKPLQKFSLEKREVPAETSGCWPNLLKMTWLIWMTLPDASSLSVRCFQPSSVPWRTGQGHSAAGEDQQHGRVALKPRLIGCLLQTPSYTACWHLSL